MAAQCPSIETTPETYQKQLLKFDMTLRELAGRIDKSVWWIFEKVTHTHLTQSDYPHTGDRYKTMNGRFLVVEWADRFAVHWKNISAFSTYEDLAAMEKM